MAEHLIRLEKVAMTIGDKNILNAIDLTVKDKEFLTLLGPSGCGKTTTLRIIGGFETPTSGVVYFDGQKMNGLPPHKRNINTVFQKYALFTHLDVYDNIAFGLRLKKTPAAETEQKVAEMLALVNLRGYEDRQVTSLSGGEQQRVAIARALVNRPRVLLLDEPLGALDLKLRKEMQTELKNIQTKLGITFIYVTHDQEEALTMSDTIVVMKDGNIQQVGTPIDIYNEPANAFVADFIGESNILPGVMPEDGLVVFLGGTFDCLDGGFERDEAVDVVIRPEDIFICEPEDGQMSGVVRSVIFKGVHYEMMVAAPGFTWMIHSTVSRDVGQEIGMRLAPDAIHIMKKTPAEEVPPHEA